MGGIYSVLKSKATVTTAEYGERYNLIGPLNRTSATVEVEELTPSNPDLYETIKSMRDRGINLLYGRWLIEGAPRVVLIDTGTGFGYLDEWKTDLWNTAGIPSPTADHETNEAIVFGYLVAWFLGEVCRLVFLRMAIADQVCSFSFPSSLPMNDIVQLLLISMNGSPVLLFP